MGGGGSAPAPTLPPTAPNWRWSETNCITTYSPCDPYTNSIEINCIENDTYFDNEILIGSKINIPTHIIEDNTSILAIDVYTKFHHSSVTDLTAGLFKSFDIPVMGLFAIHPDADLNDTLYECEFEHDVDVLIKQNSPNQAWNGIACDNSSYGIGGIHRPFSTRKYDNVQANGDWILIIEDTKTNGIGGEFGEWSMKLYLDETFCITTYPPTTEPTMEPTIEPTINPTINPTENPTFDPTVNPTNYPSTYTTTDDDDGIIDSDDDDDDDDNGDSNDNQEINPNSKKVLFDFETHLADSIKMIFIFVLLCCILTLTIIIYKVYRKNAQNAQFNEETADDKDDQIEIKKTPNVEMQFAVKSNSYYDSGDHND